MNFLRFLTLSMSDSNQDRVYSRHTAGDKQGHMKSMTLSFKVKRQGHVFVFNIFDIPDLENVKIDTKIDFVSCLQPEI